MRTKLDELMKDAQEEKESWGVSAVGRRWSIFCTELEKLQAYYIAYLEAKPQDTDVPAE